MAQGAIGRDSVTRQTNAIEAALKKHGLTLDAEFHDWGKSAYKQRHIDKGGALYELRRLAVSGKLQGKCLVLENWDRYGRLQATDACPLLMDMLTNGVDVVAGSDGGDYFSRESVNANPFLLYRAIDEMNRGFGESKRKSEMAKAKWQTRFAAVAEKKFMPLNSLPFWLENGKGCYKVRDGMHELLKGIFDAYLKGDGAQVIAGRLNAKNVPLPTRKNGAVRKNANGWYPNYIQRLIKDRSLLGYYFGTEHKIYPAVIDETTFNTINQKRQSRIHFGGRKAVVVNPYSGLCVCSTCGGHIIMQRSGPSKWNHNYTYLQCGESRRGKCSAAGIPYEKFEESFVGLLPYVENLYQQTQTLEPLKSDEIKINLINTDRQIEKLKKILLELEDPTKAISLATMLTDLDTKRKQLAKEHQAEIIRERGTPKLDNGRLDYLKGLFSGGKLKDIDTRKEIQEALRSSIDRITVNAVKRSYKVTWKNSTNVYRVQISKQGFKVTGTGCVNLEMTDFNR